MDTTWIKIKEYPNYSISDKGDVKNDTTNRILKYYIRNGYKSITLCKNNKKKTFNIHNIVAEHFLTKINNCVVNHKDENKLNNCLENLEYITYAENTKYSASNKRTKNEESYNLDNFKHIPNYSNYMISKDGKIYSKSIKRLCRCTILPSGYHKIKLKSDSNTYKDLYIHVIVAITYLNYIPSTNQYVINHIDSNKSNNTLENLEIVTQKQNMIHSIKMNNHKLFRKSVYYIDNDGKIIEYESAKDASDKTGIDNSSIIKSCKSEHKKAGKQKWYYKSNS